MPAWPRSVLAAGRPERGPPRYHRLSLTPPSSTRVVARATAARRALAGPAGTPPACAALGVTHIYLPKTDLSRLALLAPRRMCGNADLLNAHGGCGRWIEHDYRNRKVRRKHVELLRLADIDGILTRVVADTHASAHTQQFGNRHMIRSCGEQSSASRCCRIGLGLAGRVQTRE